MKRTQQWIVVHASLMVMAIFLKANELYVEKNNKIPEFSCYADCVRYELLLAEIHNVTLSSLQKICNNLFLEETKKYSKLMKTDKSVQNYVSHMLRGLNSKLHNVRRRKKRTVFTNDVFTRREVREPPYEKNWWQYVKNVRRLKHNFDVNPYMNTYDVIAHLHTEEDVALQAHDGPGFNAWHRMFLKILELALGCALPYWDTTLDEAMYNPQNSILWTDKYFGNGFGVVSTGIMRDLPSWIPIIRNINSGGWLISRTDVDMAQNKKNLYEFTEWSPCTDDDRRYYSWECFHKGIHAWVDGTIGPSNTTTFDPIFYCIHAFIDKGLELFLQKMRAQGVDPVAEFPDKGIPLHEPDHVTMWIPIYPDIEPLRNRQCFGDDLASLTIYSDAPKCPHCWKGTKDVYCHKTKNVCVSRASSIHHRYRKTTVASRYRNGEIFYIDTIKIDDPNRTKEVIDKMGPLPFGPKYRIGRADSRTRQDTIPELS